MIFEHSVKYRFDKPILKVHLFSPAFDDSVVILGLKGTGEDSLFHYDKHSKLVYQYDFNDFADSLCMPTLDTAIVLRPEDGNIVIFDLLAKTHRIIKHNYICDLGCQCYLNYFCDTRLLCVHQNGDHDDHRLKLTYYSWPLQMQSDSKSPKPAVEFEGLSDVWNPSYQVRKINAHSQYAWCHSRHKQEFNVRFHEIVGGKSHYFQKSVKLNSLYQPYKLSSMEAAIIEMWEFQPKVLILFCTTTKNQQSAVNPQTGVVNNTFIWDLEFDTIRESKFTLSPKYHDLQVDIYGCPTFSMFRTFYLQPGKAVASPAYYISNTTESIFHEQSWVCSHLQKYRVQERNRETIVQGVYQHDNTKQMSIRTISMCQRREMSMFLLNEMIHNPQTCVQSWQYGLLNDIFSLMDYKEYN